MSEEEKLQLENECLLKYSKAQMIQKYIDELEENCTLSDLWCKSQEENKELKQKVKYYENFEINKTVDKIRLENNKREKELQLQLQQKENIIKEVREYITSYINQFNGVYPPVDMRYLDLHKLLKILDKASDE